MIDQGSGVDVMYPDLYRVLGLKKEDLSKYDMPLMGFNGHMVIPEGQISLLVSTEGKKVTVTFIVVISFSPYTKILGRPGIHDMGAMPSTLHVKVKFRTEDGITVIRGNQQGSFEAKDPQMFEHLWVVKETMGYFSSVKVEQIARGQNRHTESLAMLALSIANEVPRLTRVELVAELSISARTDV
ncbi:uncharacterized protein LOC142634220 [Castanea sativa]|uniref:uncharacterized protein LOC142634220 n=1 Tax=Castanea sativa TaxID=21020 RepID=UPI003F650823